MEPSTKTLTILPWTGGINTAFDASQIAPDELVTCDQVVKDTRGSMRTRDGINFNWDNGSNGSASVVGEHDFWYGTSSKSQLKVSVFSDGTVYSYTNGGVRTQLTVDGTAWSGTLTSASLITFGNKVWMAVSGANNVVKYWDGSNHVQDLYANYNNVTIKRSSSGTTRTLVFSAAFGNGDPAAINGSTVIVANCSVASYNGTFTITAVSTTNVANDTISYTAGSSLSESTTTETAAVVGKPGPQASILRAHLGRIFCNDKTNADRLHFCQTYDPTQWLGVGDSGARDIGVGDGDPVGVNGISPTFKGNLFVGKKTKLYRCSGDPASADFSIDQVSDSLGFASHNSIAPIDEDDIFFVSDKGVHSLEATMAYGDFDAQYISKKIQKTFNESFNRSRLPNVWAAYLSNINSVGFTFSSLGSSANDSLYFYHLDTKSWYTWSGISCQSLIVANDTDKRRFYIGSNTGRIAKTFNSTAYDVNSSGTNTAIQFHLKTGIIYPDSQTSTSQTGYTFANTNAQSITKGFKRLILYFSPPGTFSFTATVKVDNFSIPRANSLVFSGTSGGDLVGSTFITGQSVVGYSSIVAPYSRTIDGYGKGVTIEITQNSIGQTIELQGFGLEYEVVGMVPEVFLQ